MPSEPKPNWFLYHAFLIGVGVTGKHSRCVTELMIGEWCVPTIFSVGMERFAAAHRLRHLVAQDLPGGDSGLETARAELVDRPDVGRDVGSSDRGPVTELVTDGRRGMVCRGTVWCGCRDAGRRGTAS